MSESSLSLLRALRRPGDEAQLTKALHGVFSADPRLASSFVRLVLTAADDGIRALPPPELECRAEETFEEGRLDLRFSSGDAWDVIVELKIYAGYGEAQLARYLRGLRSVEHAYLVAITRDVPRSGERDLDDPRWLGSVRWRRILKGTKALKPTDELLAAQWPLFLAVLEREGSMGFTRPNLELFAACAAVRPLGEHLTEFLRVLEDPLLDRLRTALSVTGDTADLYTSRATVPVVSKSWSGVIYLTFTVPANGPESVRVGVFAYNPPTRFYIAPAHGRRLVAKRALLSVEQAARLDELLAGPWRDTDLHAFLPLTESLLESATLEEQIVDWADKRFQELAKADLLRVQHSLGKADRSSLVDEERGDVEETVI